MEPGGRDSTATTLHMLMGTITIYTIHVFICFTNLFAKYYAYPFNIVVRALYPLVRLNSILGGNVFITHGVAGNHSSRRRPPPRVHQVCVKDDAEWTLKELYGRHSTTSTLYMLLSPYVTHNFHYLIHCQLKKFV